MTLPGLSPGAIAGIAVGTIIGLVVIVCILLLVFFCGVLVAGMWICSEWLYRRSGNVHVIKFHVVFFCGVKIFSWSGTPMKNF